MLENNKDVLMDNQQPSLDLNGLERFND